MMNLGLSPPPRAFFTSALCRGVGFALFLLGVFLFIAALLLFFNGAAWLSLSPLLMAIATVAVSLVLMLLGDLLPLVVSIAVYLRGIHEELAKIAGQTESPRG